MLTQSFFALIFYCESMKHHREITMPENEEPKLSEYEKKMAKVKAKLEQRQEKRKNRFRAQNRSAISSGKKLSLNDGPN